MKLASSFEVVGQAFLETMKGLEVPDLIIVGVSSPRRLEHIFEKYARSNNVPLASIEDYWGGHVRSSVAPDLVVTVDEAAERLVRLTWPSIKTVSAGFAGIAPVTPSVDTLRALALVRSTGAKVLVYPDGGPECECALPLLVGSILSTRAPLVLIPKLHPKFKKVVHQSGEGTWDDWCQAKLRPLHEAGRILHVEASTDEVIEAADGVVSGYSSTLMRPARAGKLALTLWDSVIASQLKIETGLARTPLMLAGSYPVLESPQPLDEYLGKAWPKYPLEAFNPQAAADAVLGLIS